MSNQDHHHHHHHHHRHRQQCPLYSNCQCYVTSQNIAKAPRTTKFPPTPIKTRGANRISTTFGGSGSISGGSTSSFSTISTPSATGPSLSPLVETLSFSPAPIAHTTTSTSTTTSYSFPTHPLDLSPARIPAPQSLTKHSPLASPTLSSHPNPLKSGTFGPDPFHHTSPPSPTSATSNLSPPSPTSHISNANNGPMEYFPPFDTTHKASPTSPLSPLNHDDNDIIRNKQIHTNHNNESNDNDDNDYDYDHDNHENTTTRSNSISFPSRKERHTFGYDDHHRGPPSFLDLPSSPVVNDYEGIHPLDPSPSSESPPPSPLHPPTSLYTTPTHSRPMSLPPKNVKRPVVSPTFVHDQHLASDAPPPTSSYKPSIAHRSHPNNIKHAHSAHSTPRVNCRCSLNMTMAHNSNDTLTSSQPNHASDKKPNSKSAHPKRRKRFSFFANAFSNSTAPMTPHPPSHSSYSYSSGVPSPTERISQEDRSRHPHHPHHQHSNPPRHDSLLLPSLQARPSTSLSHRFSHNTLTSQTDLDFLTSAPVSSKKHLSPSSSTLVRSRPCSPLTPVDLSPTPSIATPLRSQGGLAVQIQDDWRWSNASTRAIYDRSDGAYAGDATFPEGQSAMFASLSSPTSPSSSMYPGSILPYAVDDGPGSQESLVFEEHPQQQRQQQPMHGIETAAKPVGTQFRYSESASVKARMTKSMEEQGGKADMQGRQFEFPPPASPRTGSSQDRAGKKKYKGLSIFCFFAKK